MRNGQVRPCELERALGIPHRTVMNWQRQLAERGPESFFRSRGSRGGTVMTPEVVAACEGDLASGLSVAQVAAQNSVNSGTLTKAMSQKRVRRVRPAAAPALRDEASSKAERSREDAECELGTACSRPAERLLAAMGVMEHAESRYERCDDVAYGGVLAGLPALAANGLFHRIQEFYRLPKGFYGLIQLFMFFGLTTLARIQRLEGLRYVPPGELGKLLGLDRVPEVKTARGKVTVLAEQDAEGKWGKALCGKWMEDDPQEAGYLYVDGHVRVYHGALTELPKRYVTRERLCLRGTTDYWVNDAIGRPFFVVSKTVSDGLAKTLLEEIVPQLLATVPSQPSQEALDADNGLHRFAIVFDREGSNATLIRALWENRIGAITYRKNVKDEWPVTEFAAHTVHLPMGNVEEMLLAERPTTLGTGAAAIAVREVRKLSASGRQVAIIATLWRGNLTEIAARMFTRWCQENYFAYAKQHFELDGLVEYGTAAIPGTTTVINPEWRTLEKTVKSATATLVRKTAKFGEMQLPDESPPKTTEKALLSRAKILEEINADQAALDEIKARRKATPKHILFCQLPEEQKFDRLAPVRKQFCDTIKMIAYRAETALVQQLRPHLKRDDDARALLRQLFLSCADLIPDEAAKSLTVRIHRMTNPAHDKAVASLLETLNAADFTHPETGHAIRYIMT